MQMHRYSVFALDGTCVNNGVLCWIGNPRLLVPPRVWGEEYGEFDHYLVPMDDHPDVWHRIEAEIYVRNHPDEGLRPYGNLGKLRHSGGTPHPEPQLFRASHVQLGGTFTWESAPHPAVQDRMDEMQGKDFVTLFRHFAGQDSV